MRGKDLYEKITDIEDEIIIESGKFSNSQKRFFVKFGALVACLALIISAVSFFGNNKITTDPSLPLLTLNTEFSDGMGFEGHMANDISDLVTANPWQEKMKLAHLPVIKNKLHYNEVQRVENPNYELMESLLKDTAKSLSMDIDTLPITNDVPDEETRKAIIKKLTMGGGEVPKGYFDIGRLFIEDDNFKIEVDTTNIVKVEFKTPVKLSEQYNFTHNATYEETQEVAKYLKKEYKNFIGMKNPTIAISGGGFDIYGEQSYTIAFYEDSSKDVQSILNYHFNTVEFYCNDDGALFLARRYYTDLSEVAGDYPIINSKKALELLENGNYITTAPQEFGGVEQVKKVELIYRTDAREKLFIPYYRFYVELHNMKNEREFNTYGAYYVVAVEGQYIENMPVWDGNFN